MKLLPGTLSDAKLQSVTIPLCDATFCSNIKEAPSIKGCSLEEVSNGMEAGCGSEKVWI